MIDQIKTTGQEHDFWPRLKKGMNISRCELNVSDSHLFAYHLAKKADVVVLFDAHHDCFEEKTRNIMCHNWLRVWLSQSDSRRIIWVIPDWQNIKMIPVPKDIRNRVKVLKYSDYIPVDRANWLHVCRSGCWTPPWLDDAFLAFVRASGKDLSKACIWQTDRWNPLERRWSDEHLKQVLEVEKQIRAKLSQLMIVTMKSSDFLNGRVEQAVEIKT